MEKAKFKKIILLMAIFTILATNIVFANEVQTYQVSIDRKAVNFTGELGYPMNTNGRTFVPIRVISENMGYRVGWSDVHRKVTISDEKTIVEFEIGENIALVNGKQVPMDIRVDENGNISIADTMAMLIGERTYVPIRFIAEAFGAEVGYRRDGNVHLITINTEKDPVENSFVEPQFELTQYDYKTFPDGGGSFVIGLINQDEYIGTDAVFSSSLISHPEYNKWIMPHPFEIGETLLVDDTNRYQNKKPNSSVIFDVYEFEISNIMINPETGQPHIIPPVGEMFTIRIKITMNGITKSYLIDVPFLEGNIGDHTYKSVVYDRV